MSKLFIHQKFGRMAFGADLDPDQTVALYATFPISTSALTAERPSRPWGVSPAMSSTAA
jgi:hypothetical protein